MRVGGPARVSGWDSWEVPWREAVSLAVARRAADRNLDMRQHLRPIERRVLAMLDEGLDEVQIAERIRRSPEHVLRIIAWTEIPRRGVSPRRSPRPIESRVLALRAQGETHEQIARRFRRSTAFIRQVEGLAHYKLARTLLARST